MSFFGTFGVMSGAMYNPAVGVTKMDFGYGGGFNYTYFFKPTFGITFGAEVLTWKSQYDLAEFPIGNDPANDGEEDFRLLSKLYGYSESQNLMSLLLPIMLNFETKGKRVKFFVNAGAKLNIILMSEYTSMAEKIETKGYYPQYEITFENINFMGFGSHSNVMGKGKLPLRGVSPVLSAEMGIKIGLSRDWFMYLGGYFDYGLGVFTKPDLKQAFVKYHYADGQAQQDFYAMNTVLYSQHSNESVFVDAMNLMSAGVKLKIAFNTEIVVPDKSEPKSLDLDFLSDKKEPAPVVVAAPPITNEAPPTEIKQQVAAGEEDNVPLIIKRRITFGLKSFNLSATNKKLLDDKVRVMEKNPDLKITVRGNANDYFDKKTEKDGKLKKAAELKNKKLSQQRAKAIKDYLSSKGISGSRIKTTARGSKSPLAPDTTPRNRAKNRRADFVMGGKVK
jgi:outer membrane protein OmpA-like peptidoglycan-associated protein